VQKAV